MRHYQNYIHKWDADWCTICLYVHVLVTLVNYRKLPVFEHPKARAFLVFQIYVFTSSIFGHNLLKAIMVKMMCSSLEE